MKKFLKPALSLYGRIITINIMCFFLVISISVLIEAAFSENIGYTLSVYETETEKLITKYDHFYADGEDEKRAEYESNPKYTLDERKNRSEVSKTGDITFKTVSAALCTIILISFIYPKFWQMGTKDSNLVHFKHQREDKLKGLKIGLLSAIPGIILLIVFMFFIPTVNSALYKILCSGLYVFIELILGSSKTFADLSILQFIGLLLLKAIVPLTAFGAYLLGYKNISLHEKLVYKKNKDN